MGIVDNAKDIAELIKKMGNMDLYEKIMDLRGEIFQLKEENLNLRERVKTFEASEDVKSNMRYDPPYYWLEKDENKDGPYCQKCYDDEGKLMRLQDQRNSYWYCLSCQSGVTDKSYRPPMDGNTQYHGF